MSQTKRGRNGKEKDRQNEILSQNPKKTQRERSTDIASPRQTRWRKQTDLKRRLKRKADGLLKHSLESTTAYLH